MGQRLPSGVAPFVVEKSIIFAALAVTKMRYANQRWDIVVWHSLLVLSKLQIGSALC